MTTEFLHQHWQETTQNVLGSDDAFALLRLAVSGDQLAWSSYHRMLNPLVAAWIKTTSGNSLDLDERETATGDTWMRFARQMSPEKLSHFPAHATVAQYLKLCARSAVFDLLRTRKLREREVEWSDACTELPGHADPFEIAHLHEIKHTVLRTLRSPDEQLLAFLIFFCHYQPREVAARYPDRWSSAEAVHTSLRRVRDRLRQSEELYLMLKGEVAHV